MSGSRRLLRWRKIAQRRTRGCSGGVELSVLQPRPMLTLERLRCMPAADIFMTQPNRRILIVDDNRAAHDDLGEILREIAMAVEPSSAYGGGEGVAMVRAAVEAGRPYAMAVVAIPAGIDARDRIDERSESGARGPTDFAGREGACPLSIDLEAIARMWEIDAELQVALCTAHAGPSWQDIARRFGATDQLLILRKPFDVVEVCQLVIALTRKWQLAHEARAQTAALARSRAELVASLALARAVHDATADGLIVIGPDRKASTVNQRMLEMWQLSPEVVATADLDALLEAARDHLVDPDTTAARIRHFEDHPDESGTDEVQRLYLGHGHAESGQPRDRAPRRTLSRWTA